MMRANLLTQDPTRIAPVSRLQDSGARSERAPRDVGTGRRYRFEGDARADDHGKGCDVIVGLYPGSRSRFEPGRRNRAVDVLALAGGALVRGLDRNGLVDRHHALVDGAPMDAIGSSIDVRG